VGLYSRQGGKLGLTGFTLGIIGTGLVLLVLGRAFTSSDLAAVESDPSLAAPTILGLSLGQLALGIGVILLGISGLHAEKSRASKGLPLGVGLLGVISGVIFWQVLYVPLSQGRFPWEPWNVGMYVLYPVVHVLLGIGWLILGSTLATEADAQIAPVSPVSA